MKTVLFTQRVEVIESYDERRDCADQRISEFIGECGYLPIPLPNNYIFAKEYIETIKPAGIVLTGGNSLVKYGGNAPERDRMDAELIKHAIDNNIPIYGFCRGMQSILDYFDNELVNVQGHVAIKHEVYGNEAKMLVNSYHNQACVSLSSDELIISFKTEDGVIEAITHKNLPIEATMWHPERDEKFSIADIDRVKKLFK